MYGLKNAGREKKQLKLTKIKKTYKNSEYKNEEHDSFFKYQTFKKERTGF